MKKIVATAVLVLAGAAMLAMPGAAHHGWSWTTGGNIELIGVIKQARLGMPHGVLKVDAEGELWTVEVGQPWRNERAGLKAGDLSEGVELRAIGQPSADLEEKLMKAERLYIGEVEYNLYPNRD